MFSPWAAEVNLEHIQDLFNVIRNQELDGYACADYLKADSKGKDNASAGATSWCPSSTTTRRSESDATLPSENGVDEELKSVISPRHDIIQNWREKIVEWSYRVVDHFDLDRRVVAHSMMNLDRYLALRPVNSWEFQLAAATSLFISVKVSEQKLIPIGYYVNLGAGRFNLEHMVEMECDILRTLKWRINPPTPVLQAKILLFILPNHVPYKGMIYEISRFLTELCVIDYFFVPFKSSSIATAAVMCSMDIIGESIIDRSTAYDFVHKLQRLTDIDVYCHDIKVCRDRMMIAFHESGVTLSNFDEAHMRVEYQPMQNIVSPIENDDIEISEERSYNKECDS